MIHCRPLVRSLFLLLFFRFFCECAPTNASADQLTVRRGVTKNHPPHAADRTQHQSSRTFSFGTERMLVGCVRMCGHTELKGCARRIDFDSNRERKVDKSVGFHQVEWNVIKRSRTSDMYAILIVSDVLARGATWRVRLKRWTKNKTRTYDLDSVSFVTPLPLFPPSSFVSPCLMLLFVCPSNDHLTHCESPL